jgi:hypothetical protein
MSASAPDPLRLKAEAIRQAWEDLAFILVYEDQEYTFHLADVSARHEIKCEQATGRRARDLTSAIFTGDFVPPPDLAAAFLYLVKIVHGEEADYEGLLDVMRYGSLITYPAVNDNHEPVEVEPVNPLVESSES